MEYDGTLVLSILNISNMSTEDPEVKKYLSAAVERIIQTDPVNAVFAYLETAAKAAGDAEDYK